MLGNQVKIKRPFLEIYQKGTTLNIRRQCIPHTKSNEKFKVVLKVVLACESKV